MLAPIINLNFAKADSLRMPATTAWLSDAERAALARYRSPLRRIEWLAGRWLAKQAIITVTPQVCFKQISIHSFCGLTRRGVAPQVSINGSRWSGTLSIAHADGWVAAAIQSDGLPLGIDLACFQPITAGFAAIWFTPSEQTALRGRDDATVLRYWTAKEALYKAVGGGSTFHPRDYELHCDHDYLLSPAQSSDVALREYTFSAGLVCIAGSRHCAVRVGAPAGNGRLIPRQTSFTKVSA